MEVLKFIMLQEKSGIYGYTKKMSWKQTKLINPKTKIANLDISKGEYYKKQYHVIQFTWLSFHS